MITLQAGANITLTGNELLVTVEWRAPSVPADQIDVSAFLLGTDERVRSDADFIFYNQPATPDSSLCLQDQQRSSDGGCRQAFRLRLDQLPADVGKIAFTVVIHSAHDFSAAEHLKLGVEGQAEFFPLTRNMTEKALILGHLYRHQGNWKFRALGQGFNGGLAPLATHFGVDVADQPTPQAPPPPPPKASASPSSAPTSPARTVDLEKRLAAQAPRLISLAKPIRLSLEKKQLTQTRARVAFVLDASGSMMGQFRSGNVQAVLDRIAPLAVQFDDDESMELWAFADKCAKYDDVSLANLDGYVERLTKKEKRGFFSGISLSIVQGLGCGNNEPPVMRDIIQTYKDSDLPAYVVFITDGGIYKNDEIKALLKEASDYPIFWQYVGLGGQRYGILEALDTLPGRTVDNANFFAIDDFRNIQDQALYDRLLDEFPAWLNAARQAGILRA